MDETELASAFARILADVAPLSFVHAIESGADWTAIWQQFEESGFLDALVPEEKGGADLTLAEAGPLIELIGRHALPLPVAETIAARGWLGTIGATIPVGPIALVTSRAAASVVPGGGVAQHFLVDTGEDLVLLGREQVECAETGVSFALSAWVSPRSNGRATSLPRPDCGLRPLAALVRSCLIAGAAGHLLELSTAYANAREQFGKPIGRLQVLQQNLAVMAEDAVAIRIAARLACTGSFPPSPRTVAVAKSVASTAVPRIAATAHAIHGAIGISAEHDLQLLARRLHEWRLADGGEGYWNRLLGQERMESPLPSVDWIRRELVAAA